MTAETCPRCSTPVDDHTVAGLRECMRDLHDDDLPFEPIPQTDQDLRVITAGAVAVKAAVHSSPVGSFPVLVFDFTGPDGPVPSIALVLDDTHMRSVRTLVSSAVDAALRAARKGGR